MMLAFKNQRNAESATGKELGATAPEGHAFMADAQGRVYLVPLASAQPTEWEVDPLPYYDWFRSSADFRILLSQHPGLGKRVGASVPVLDLVIWLVDRVDVIRKAANADD